MAGKLHAVLSRRYTKGRDWYDLMWYLSQRPPVAPNLTLLQHALDQTQGLGRVEASQWAALARARRRANERTPLWDLNKKRRQNAAGSGPLGVQRYFVGNALSLMESERGEGTDTGSGSR